MTESQARAKLVNTAISYLGCKESDGTHRKIIDLYNRHKPLARNYKVTYKDPWCATFGSAMAVACGFTDIIPTECSCTKQIELFQKLGSWVENDAHIPKPGDYVFYDWQDSGKGDNTGGPDHVGIVVSVTGNALKIIEGNITNAVGYRDLRVDGRYIRGYGVPKYAVNAFSAEDQGAEFKVGDIVQFTGTKHYVSSNSTNGKTCKPGKARVTALASTGRHRVHLVAVTGGGSNVYGWVDTASITRESATLAVGARVKVVAGAKTYTGVRLASFVYSNTYEVISISGDRVVIGIDKAITAAVHKKDLTVV